MERPPPPPPSESLPTGEADSISLDMVRRGRLGACAEPEIVDELESCESSGGMLPPPEAANAVN